MTAGSTDAPTQLQGLPAPLLLFESDGRFLWANDAATQAIANWVPATDVASVLDALVNGTPAGEVRALVDAARRGERAKRLVQLDAPDPSGETELRTALEPSRPLPCFCELSAAPWGDGHVVMSLVNRTEEVRTRAVLDRSVETAMILDDQARRVWGPAGHDAGGRDLPDGTAGDRIHPEDMGIASSAFVRALEEPGRVEAVTLRARRLENDTWYTNRVELLNAIDDPTIGGVVSLVQRADEFTLASPARTTGTHLSIAEAAPVGIILTGPRGLPMYFNSAAKRLLPGVGVDDDRQQRDWLTLAIEQDREELRSLIATSAEGEEQSMVAGFAGPGEDPDTDIRWFVVTSCPRLTEDDTLAGLVVTLQDVTSEIQAKKELEVAQRQLVHHASHDPLTGLVNRAALEVGLRARLADSSPEQGVALLFCDLDGFKQINDDHGHAIGDRVLADAAERMRGTAERIDPDALVARVGGDEFVIALGPVDDPRRYADTLAPELIRALTEPFPVRAGRASISVSIGIAVAEDGEDHDSLVGRADVAMYEAKAAGPGRAVHADG